MKKTTFVWILSIVLVVLNFIFYIFKIGGEDALTMISDLFPVVCAVVAVSGLLIAFKSFKAFDLTKLAWLMFLLGYILFFLGESTYAFLDLVYKCDMNEYFPSIADYFWVTGYLPLLIGLGVLIWGFKKSGFILGHWLNYLWISVIFIMITTILVYRLLIPIAQDSETTALAKFFYFAYPVFDLFLILFSFIIVRLTSLLGKGLLSKPWKYIAAGFVFMTVADIIYSYYSWLGVYGAGSFIDVAWNSGYLLIGLGGLYQAEILESL